MKRFLRRLKENIQNSTATLISAAIMLLLAAVGSVAVLIAGIAMAFTNCLDSILLLFNFKKPQPAIRRYEGEFIPTEGVRL